jgi:aryl-alcohol dehydrogenase-like predicted oxidoreductase
MLYRRIGTADLEVSEIAFGTWRTFGSNTKDEVARASIRRAHELGVTLFDTANVYRRGAIESLLGGTLAPLPRESYVVCTKAGYPTGDGPDDRGLSRTHLTAQCHASLRRLRTGHIDLFVCHLPDDATPMEETLSTLDDLVTAGTIRHAGVSSWSARSIVDARRIAHELGLRPPICNQPQYSLLVREAESDVLPTADRLGMGSIVWAPLAQGVLSGKYRPDAPPPAGTRGSSPGYRRFMGDLMSRDALERAAALAPIAHQAGLPLAQLALAWVLRRREVSSAVVGVSSPQQLEDLVAASGIVLTDDALAAIDVALQRAAPPQN